MYPKQQQIFFIKSASAFDFLLRDVPFYWEVFCKKKCTFTTEYIFFLKPDRLSGRDDVALDMVNLRPDIRQNVLFKKNSDHQEVLWILKQFGATAPW